MRTIYRPAPDSLCHCGRPDLPPHCRFCGSGNVYARAASNRVEQRSGNEIEYLGYFCRRCGQMFDVGMPCAAPQHVTRTPKARVPEPVVKPSGQPVLSDEERAELQTATGDRRYELLAKALNKTKKAMGLATPDSLSDDLAADEAKPEAPPKEWHEKNPIFTDRETKA